MSTPIARAVLANSKAFAALSLRKKLPTTRQQYMYMAVFGFVAGCSLEAFMCMTGFYKVTAQITARRWHQQAERKEQLNAAIYEEAEKNFRLQLERRRRVGGSGLDELPKEMLEKPPNLYNVIKDSVYPSESGWGAWDKQGKAKA